MSNQLGSKHSCGLYRHSRQVLLVSTASNLCSPRHHAALDIRVSIGVIGSQATHSKFESASKFMAVPLPHASRPLKRGIPRHRIDTVGRDTAGRSTWLPCALGPAPVDAFQQHRQLRQLSAVPPDRSHPSVSIAGSDRSVLC